MFDQEDRHLAIQPLQKFGHLRRLARRQPGGRLIEQENVGIAGQPQYDLELALLAVREMAHLDVLAIDERGALQQMVRLVIDVAIRRQEPPHHEFRRAPAFDGQQNIVEDRESRKQACDLEGARHAKRGAPMARPRGDILAEQQHLSGTRREYPGDQIEQRGLASAVRPDNGLTVTRHDLERYAAHGSQAAEGLRQVPQLEHFGPPPSIRGSGFTH